MIKKLVKYGNSQALVLDKALLEILNISDATKLKLSTDGTSLTITPLHETQINEQAETPVSPISATESEAEMHYGALTAQQQRDELQYILNNPEKNQQLYEDFKETSEAFFKKYNYGQRMIELTSSQKYKDGVKKIALEAYKQNLSLEEYNKKISEFMQECMPTIPLKELQETWKEFEKKYKNSAYKPESSDHQETSDEMQTALESKKNVQKAFLRMLEKPELFQQMQWEYKESVDEFDRKYNYTQKLNEAIFNPLYKEAVEKLLADVTAGKLSGQEHSLLHQDLIQSFMPNVPMKEIHEAFGQLEKKYAALLSAEQKETAEKPKN